jgi:hypothetical protein
MYATSRILFICIDGEDCCPFLAAVRAAGFCVLVADAAKDIEVILADEPVAAITIHQDILLDGCCMAAEFKRAAPGTPLILFRARYRPDEVKPFGVDAVCYVDPRDDGLCRSAAIFLRLVLDNPPDGQSSTVLRLSA